MVIYGCKIQLHSSFSYIQATIAVLLFKFSNNCCGKFRNDINRIDNISDQFHWSRAFHLLRAIEI